MPVLKDHTKVLHGLCGVCGHYGEDCTGTEKGGQTDFVAVNGSGVVMRGQNHVGTMCSHTMAKRTANALNVYRPGRRGA